MSGATRKPQVGPKPYLLACPECYHEWRSRFAPEHYVWCPECGASFSFLKPVQLQPAMTPPREAAHHASNRMHYAPRLADTAACGVDVRRGGGTGNLQLVSCGNCKRSAAVAYAKVTRIVETEQ